MPMSSLSLVPEVHLAVRLSVRRDYLINACVIAILAALLILIILSRERLHALPR